MEGVAKESLCLDIDERVYGERRNFSSPYCTV
jgi:hypothetical protein